MTIQDILKNVDKVDSGCWLWKGGINSRGYGVVWVNGANGNKRAHQVFYGQLVGPVQAGLVLDHICRVRHCCNPKHMRQITAVQNVMCGNGITAKNTKKTHCKKGHELTHENTYYVSGGERRCRICEIEKSRKYRLKKKGTNVTPS